MRLGANLSKFLTATLIPLLCWGLIATLVLHLIEVRAAFIDGGEQYLRLAAMAFALAVVLIGRLTHLEGKTVAKAYAWTLGGSMLFFILYHASAYEVPGVSSAVVIFANLAIFGVLWWAGQTVSEACSVDSVFDVTQAAETGILYRTSREWRTLMNEQADAARAGQDDDWSERLPGRHPGRVVFFFSLVAIPVFALGIVFFDDTHAYARERTAMFLFTYLVCAFGLLTLSHLRQLAVYYAKRDISLPDAIALPWLAIAGLVALAVICVALFLPQPPSLPGAILRERVAAEYRGLMGAHGLPDTATGKSGVGHGSGAAREGSGGGQNAGGAPAGDAGAGAAPAAPETVTQAAQRYQGRFANVDRLGDPYASSMARQTGIEPYARNLVALSWAVNDTFRAWFAYLLKALVAVFLLAAPVVLYMIVMGTWQALTANPSGRPSLRTLLRLRGAKPKDPKKPSDPDRPRFRLYTNPFARGPFEGDGDALVRLCWEATLALCADCGTPCPPEKTPLEFVAAAPAALRGFEEQAHFIATLYTYSEFSGRPVADTSRPLLEQFWTHLERHAAAPAEA